MRSACPTCGLVANREPYDIGSGPELSCAACEWCWGADGQDLVQCVVHPGPMRIDAGSAPGGVVIHIYTVPDGALFLRRAIPAHAAHDAGDFAVSDRAALTGDCCLVAYDGDTGERMGWPT